MNRHSLQSGALAFGLLAAAFAASGSAPEPTSTSRCFSNVHVHPETGDTVGTRLHLVLHGSVASGTLAFYEGNATPTRVQAQGSFERGYLVLSSVPNSSSVPFTLSGSPGSRAFEGTITFHRGATTDTERVSFPAVPLTQCTPPPTQ